jgi:transglutaminase-like putative cysteine protease
MRPEDRRRLLAMQLAQARSQPSVVRTVTFHDGEAKANWLDANATLDARLPETRSLATRFAMQRIHDPNDKEALARDIHAWVRDCIRYVNDPAGEELSDSDQVLAAGFGDCDDKARLFVALCRAIGIESRIRPCFEGDDFVHVQAECNVGRPKRWHIVELIVRDVAFGEKPPKKSVMT